MSVVINGSTGITTPTIISAGVVGTSATGSLILPVETSVQRPASLRRARGTLGLSEELHYNIKPITLMYIVVTNVDAKTKQACTVAPMLNGPAYPPLNNFDIDWSNQSKWPIATDKSGVYLTAPEYYGTCDDDSFTGFPGVLEVIDEVTFNQRKEAEMAARVKPIIEEPI